MTVQEVIRALEAGGWKTTKSEDEVHQLEHTGDCRLVTIAGKLTLTVPLGVQRILWKQAGFEETD